GGGKSEEKFAEALDLTPRLRDTMILQTKVGIRKGSFDFSKEHILEAVEGSLKRLRTDHLDIVLLHRPDALVEPEEVAEAFTIQPWSPFQYGFFEGVFLDNPKFPELNAQIDAIAASRGVTNTAIAVAWLLRHPARMQPILGTTNPTRVKDSCKASDVKLTRQ